MHLYNSWAGYLSVGKQARRGSRRQLTGESLGVSDPKAHALRATMCRELEHELPWHDSHLGMSGSEAYPFHDLA